MRAAAGKDERAWEDDQTDTEQCNIRQRSDRRGYVRGGTGPMEAPGVSFCPGHIRHSRERAWEGSSPVRGITLCCSS